MFLTATNLAHYLLSRGTITVDDIVNDAFMAMEAGRRNINFKVYRGDKPGLFIKQARVNHPETTGSIYREAAVYELGRSSAAFAPLREVAPTLVDYDPQRHTVTIELMPRAENLNEHHLRIGGFPERVGRLQGRALGAYHRGGAQMLADPADVAAFPRTPPWIFSMARNAETIMPSMSGASQQLVGVLRQTPALAGGLDVLSALWSPRGLVHGDIKWDNIVLVDQADEDSALCVIDWELADVGDTAWDVGCALAAYVQYWLFTVPADPSQPDPAILIPHAPRPIEAIRPALRAFWEEYRRAAGLTPAEATQELFRAVLYSAGRLVLTTFELLPAAPHLTPTTALFLRLAAAIFSDPQRALAEIYGLSATETSTLTRHAGTAQAMAAE